MIFAPLSLSLSLSLSLPPPPPPPKTHVLSQSQKDEVILSQAERLHNIKVSI